MGKVSNVRVSVEMCRECGKKIAGEKGVVN